MLYQWCHRAKWNLEPFTTPAKEKDAYWRLCIMGHVDELRKEATSFPVSILRRIGQCSSSLCKYHTLLSYFKDTKAQNKLINEFN